MAKIRFLPKKYKGCDMLAERFDLDQLDESLGGRADCPFDFESYAEMMKEEDRTRNAAATT